ncbi:predicted protein [Arabidopsis lyrata subsp. lyrata]|uniref:Predicted protein n=1 Tax=Arabidopsis lyrata subsp. lyrata TaxID=81972 RepID=D7LKJ9_ARALL|nr:predicted protein [Arabidopsis lyrata subsp. lyrata]
MGMIRRKQTLPSDQISSDSPFDRTTFSITRQIPRSHSITTQFSRSQTQTALSITGQILDHRHGSSRISRSQQHPADQISRSRLSVIPLNSAAACLRPVSHKLENELQGGHIYKVPCGTSRGTVGHAFLDQLSRESLFSRSTFAQTTLNWILVG